MKASYNRHSRLFNFGRCLVRPAHNFRHICNKNSRVCTRLCLGHSLQQKLHNLISQEAPIHKDVAHPRCSNLKSQIRYSYKLNQMLQASRYKIKNVCKIKSWMLFSAKFWVESEFLSLILGCVRSELWFEYWLGVEQNKVPIRRSM